MTNEENVLLALEFANCISSVTKTERGASLTNLVKECHFPTAAIISIQKAARDYHTYGKSEKLRDSYIELITCNLWSIGILCCEQDGVFVRDFLEVQTIDKLFESIEILGEDAYEENFD